MFRSSKEIRREIRELRRYMRENNIRRIAHMNRLELHEWRPNAQLFGLTNELKNAIEREKKS